MGEKKNEGRKGKRKGRQAGRQFLCWGALPEQKKSGKVLAYPTEMECISREFWFWSGKAQGSFWEVKVAQSSLILCDPMDCDPWNSPARLLEWVAFPFSRGSFQPWDRTWSPALQTDSLPAEPQGKSKNTGMGSLSLLQWIFPTLESNWCLLHFRWILYQLSHQESPERIWVMYKLVTWQILMCFVSTGWM